MYRSRLSSRKFLATFTLLVVMCQPALAWPGWFDDAVEWAGDKADQFGDWVGDQATGAGRVIGRPIGSFVDSATGPVISRLEQTGESLISKGEEAAGRSMDKMEAVLGRASDKAISGVDKMLGEKIDKVDSIMQARIVQVEEASLRLIDHSAERFQGIVDSGFSQATKLETKAIADLQDTAKIAIAKLDGVLQANIRLIASILQDTIAQIDSIISRHIEEVDELSQERLGNLDVIVAKNLTNAETAARHVVTLAISGLFVGVILILVVAPRITSKDTQADTTIYLRQFRNPLIAGFIFSLLLVVAINTLILTSSHNYKNLLSQWERASEQAFAAGDFRRAKLACSQLMVLDPSNARYPGLSEKATLLRDIFSRSTFFAEESNFVEASYKLNSIASRLPEDPDVQAVKGFLILQSGRDLLSEYAAAQHFAYSLKLYRAREAKEPSTPFSLKSIALMYLWVYLEDPFADHAIAEITKNDPQREEQLKRHFSLSIAENFSRISREEMVSLLKPTRSNATENVVKPEPNGPLATVLLANHSEVWPGLEYAFQANEIITPTLTKSNQQYAASLNKINSLERADEFKKVVELWLHLNSVITKIPSLDKRSSALRLFQMNDAQLTRAAYYAVTKDTDLSPLTMKPMTMAEEPVPESAPGTTRTILKDLDLKEHLQGRLSDYVSSVLTAQYQPASGEWSKLLDEMYLKCGPLRSMTTVERMSFAPIRVNWRNQFGNSLGNSVQKAFELQESRRFSAYEQQLLEVERSFKFANLKIQNYERVTNLIILTRLLADTDLITPEGQPLALLYLQKCKEALSEQVILTGDDSHEPIPAKKQQELLDQLRRTVYASLLKRELIVL